MSDDYLLPDEYQALIAVAEDQVDYATEDADFKKWSDILAKLKSQLGRLK